MTLLVAFAGTINPSSGSVSILVPLEHSVLSRAVEDRERTRMFARYSLIGAFAAAALLTVNPDLAARAGIDQVTAIEGMCVFYSLLDIAGGWCYGRIPIEKQSTQERPAAALGASRGTVYKPAWPGKPPGT